MINALIDNATLNSATRLFALQDSEYIAREINIQSLDSFLEAYILNETLYVDEKFWASFLKIIPSNSRSYFNEVVVPLIFNITDEIKLEDFLKSEMVFYILNIFCDSSKKLHYYEDFLSYTGISFGNYSAADGEMGNGIDIYIEIENGLKNIWGWDYNAANIDHIDIVLLCYRTLNYIEIANKNNMNLVCHEIRNYFINLVGYAYGLKVPAQLNDTNYRLILEGIQGLTNKSYVRDTRNDINSEKIVWDVMKLPFLPALIYEKSQNFEEIFSYAYEYRQKFKGYRETTEQLQELINNDEFQKSDKIIAEIDSFIKSMPELINAPSFEYTINIGLPLSFCLGITPKGKVPKYFNVFKDMAYRYSLPKSYINSCERLFGDIRWNKNFNGY